MLLSETHKFLFVHIYKNAGTSIKDALFPFAASKWEQMAYKALRMFNVPTHFGATPFRAHSTALEIIEKMGKEVFDSYFSFAVVRNPWDWQVSLYNFTLKTPTHHQHDFIKSLGGFDAYIRWRCSREARNQKHFIYSETNEMLVDFVGRFEQLDVDFKVICDRIGISASLPKLNVSNETPYRKYYADETRELVRRTFDPDIKLFGYEF